jgi:hypothetical protein
VALAVAVAGAGCSTTATIHRVHGPSYEAEIVGSTDRALEVRGHDGRTYLVPREEIADIDHPGNVTFTVGASLAAFAALLAGSIAANRGSGEVDATTPAVIVGVVYGVPGLLLALVGGLTWLSSTGAARAMESAPAAAPLPWRADQPYPPSPLPPPAPWNRPLVRKPSVTSPPGAASGASPEAAPREDTAPPQPEPAQTEPTAPEPEVVVPGGR